MFQYLLMLTPWIGFSVSLALSVRYLFLLYSTSIVEPPVCKARDNYNKSHVPVPNTINGVIVPSCSRCGKSLEDGDNLTVTLDLSKTLIINGVTE